MWQACNMVISLSDYISPPITIFHREYIDVCVYKSVETIEKIGIARRNNERYWRIEKKKQKKNARFEYISYSIFIYTQFGVTKNYYTIVNIWECNLSNAFRMHRYIYDTFILLKVRVTNPYSLLLLYRSESPDAALLTIRFI